MRPVVLESPYAGDVNRNVAYARAAVAHAIQQGDAPLASHLLYTQPGILIDLKPDERQLGIECGYEWGALARAAVVYEDLGVSHGMEKAIERYRGLALPIEFRTIPGWTWDRAALSTVTSGLNAAHDIVAQIAKLPAGDTRSTLLLMLIGLLSAVQRDALAFEVTTP